MTSNGKQFTATREMLTAVARDGWNLCAVFKFCFCFVLLYNKSLNDWSLGEQWILFSSNLNVSLDFVSGNIEKIHCSPRDQSLSVKYFSTNAMVALCHAPAPYNSQIQNALASKRSTLLSLSLVLIRSRCQPSLHPSSPPSIFPGILFFLSSSKSTGTKSGLWFSVAFENYFVGDLLVEFKAFIIKLNHPLLLSLTFRGEVSLHMIFPFFMYGKSESKNGLEIK